MARAGQRLGRRRLSQIATIVTPDTILRNHQGLGNELVDGAPRESGHRIRRRQRLGGLLNYYARAA